MKNLIEFERYPAKYKNLQDKFRAVWYVAELKKNTSHIHPINNLPAFLEKLKKAKVLVKQYLHEPSGPYGQNGFVCTIVEFGGRVWGIGEYR